ncbi:MAG: ArdC family protein [Parasporobacterium sp.]|nr:ArdC family protein [Parasporobacterium sp.]
MTNGQIILNTQIELMEQGIIGTTGRQLVIEKDDGSKEVIPEPEPIHTYAIWKEKGYQVRKGQKAVAAIQIWKHTDAKLQKDKKSGEEVEIGEKMFMKTAFFFKKDQVDPIIKST